MDLLACSLIAGAMFISGFAIGKLESQEKMNQKMDSVLEAVYKLGVKEGESKNE